MVQIAQRLRETTETYKGSRKGLTPKRERQTHNAAEAQPAEKIGLEERPTRKHRRETERTEMRQPTLSECMARRAATAAHPVTANTEKRASSHKGGEASARQEWDVGKECK